MIILTAVTKQKVLFNTAQHNRMIYAYVETMKHLCYMLAHTDSFTHYYYSEDLPIPRRWYLVASMPNKNSNAVAVIVNFRGSTVRSRTKLKEIVEWWTF